MQVTKLNDFFIHTFEGKLIKTFNTDFFVQDNVI